MHKSIIILITVLGFILASTAANALDYNDWIPLLPESIGGMEKQGDPEGINMERSGEAWSSVTQGYSDAEGNDARLKIVTGSDAPGIKEFQAMQKVSFENSEVEVKTLEISGYKAAIEFDKKGGKSHLLIAPQEETLVIIDSAAFDNKNDLISLADDIPLSEIADSVN